MLTLTENAATVVKTIAGQTSGTDAGGVRLSRRTDREDALAVDTAPAPEPGDQVVERDGARVFIAADTVEVLDDQTLDAQVDDGGGVRFTIAAQG